MLGLEPRDRQLADATEPQLEALLRIRDEEEGQLILPAPVAAKVDYLLGVRFGEADRRAFLSDLAAQLRRAAFPGRCATSGRVIRVVPADS